MPTLIYGFSVVGFRSHYIICTHNSSFRFMVLDTSKVLCNGLLCVCTVPGFVRLLYEAANCFTKAAIVSANSIVAPPALLMAVSRVSNIIYCIYR